MNCECLTVRGIWNAFVFGLCFGMGFNIAANVLALIAKLIGGH